MTREALCKHCGHRIKQDGPQPWRDYGVWYHAHDGERTCSTKLAEPRLA